MSLSTTPTVGEAVPSTTSASRTTTTTTTAAAAAAATTTTSSVSLHHKNPEDVTRSDHCSGDSGTSTVIGTNTQGPAIVEATSTHQQQQQQQQIGLSTASSGIVGVTRIRTTRTATIKRRQKVKEFNDVIWCSLCRGYLINATTIDYCVHSFCRSCIIRHLQENKHCPKCRPGGKQIALSNLRPDERLKSLVYKLVPGLYQSEHQRQVQFYSENATSRGEDQDEGGGFYDSEEDYFSPVEPISLSLEYHPESLQGCNKQQIPPIRYLQCPAAVTVHHLKRFISSKFDIDPDNERVDIEIIYEDEVLPEDFSLMDVGYCYSWKRVAPMRFFYRILVHSLCNKLNQVVLSDSVLSESDNVIEAKRAKKSNESGTQKTVRFKEINERQTKEKTVSSTVAQESFFAIPEDVNNSQTKYSVLKAKPSKNEPNKDAKGYGSNNNNDNSNRSKTSTSTIFDESQMNGGKGPVKMTIIARKPNEMKVKHDFNKTKNRGKSSTTVPMNASSSSTPVINDFKSLRSNDIRYSDYTVSSTGGSAASSSATGKSKSSSGKLKTTFGTKEASQKAVSQCDIVVSIPQAHVHRSSNSSDDSFENLSLAQLKTANKKNSSGASVVNSKNSGPEGKLKQQKSEENPKQNVPKLKIELPSLKTKFTVVKKSPEVVEPKKSPKSRKHSLEEHGNLSTNNVDLTTYAKNIGLKPINPASDEKNKEKPKISPEKSPSSESSAASSPPSATGQPFVFTAEVSGSSSHKKRKKGKHSKEFREPGSKRRKLHAEISSQPAEESLKLKVKITANHKSHKTEKKSSSNNSIEETVIPAPVVSTVPASPSIDTITAPIINLPVVSKTTNESTPNNNTVAGKAKQEIKPAQETSKPTNRNKQGVNIPNLNKTLSEESSNINNLIRENSGSKVATEQFVSNTSKLQSAGVTLSKSKTTPVVSTKGVTVTSVTIVTSAHTPSLTTANQSQAKLLPPKIVSIQEAKIPISPPLPPSLFKTTPMTLQAITTTSSKQPPTQAQPRYSTPGDIRHMNMSQLKRLSQNVPNQKGQGNFVVPNPPKSLPSSPKLCAITSIASAANRQAAQLKRSASLDCKPPMLPKQLKLDPDRTVRKAHYTPLLAQVSTSINTTQPSSSGIKTHGRSQTTVTNTMNVKVTEPQQTFYTSTMGPTYTREIMTRKPMPILVPPSSISVTKMSDVISSKLSHSSSAVTITPQQQQSSLMSYQPQQQKPALEIVRISSNIPPIDQQPIAITNNNTVKQSPPKTTRPPPPPIPLVKIKRSMNQSNALKATITTVNAPVQQSQVLSTAKSSPPSAAVVTTRTSPKLEDNSTPNGQSPVCDNIGALDLSGKSSRSPSQEKTTPTNTPPDTPTQTSTKDPFAPNKQIASSLETALNKLKRQNSTATVTTHISSANLNSTNTSVVTTTTTAAPTTTNEATKTTVTSTKATEAASKTSSLLTQSAQKLSESSNGLQNLKLLSESATNREKITIKNQRHLPMLPKLNEISKMRANPTVRQQNASVRNIPNPSALAFRSHQPIPMLASITKTTSPQKPTVSSSSSTTTTTLSTTNITPSAAISQIPKEVSSSNSQNTSTTTITTSTSAQLSEQSTTSANLTSATNTTLATIDTAKLIGSKKSHLEQLAATLNMRALSAAADASKLAIAGTNVNASSSASTNGASPVESTGKTVSITNSSSVSSPITTTVTASCDNTTGTTSLLSGTPFSSAILDAASTSTSATATTA